MQIDNVEITLDPTGHYAEQCGEHWMTRIMESAGVLPEFMFGPDESLAQNMQNAYAFFMDWTAASQHPGTHIEDDCFCFPGDPKIYPLLKAERGAETIHIYPHAIVTVSTEGDLLKWTRMD